MRSPSVVAAEAPSSVLMTATEFISELIKIRDSFSWKLSPAKGCTPERRKQGRLHIRAMNKEVAGLLDPIAALCYLRTGCLYGAQSWQAAAEMLNLSEIDAWQIMAASDDLTSRQVGEVRTPHPQIFALRIDLLKAVGLDNLAEGNFGSR